MGILPTTCGDLNREHDENIVDATGYGTKPYQFNIYLDP
jgi:hypothetical protein